MTATPVTSSPTRTPRPRIRKVAAVINPLSHSVGPDAGEVLAGAVAEFGLPLDLASPGPEGLDAAIQSALDGGPDLLLVLAGDGTAREAARLCGPEGPLVAILPGGTMNVLSRALYGPAPWPEILTGLLESGVEQMQSGGKVGGRPFYVAAVLGSPALWAPVREAVRAMDIPTAWKRGRSALSRAFAGHLRFETEGRAGYKTTGLGLICPTISRVLPGDTQALEAALLDQRDFAEVIRLGGFHLFGDWRADPKVETLVCSRGRAWARRPIPAILDGESFRLERSVSIEFVPKAYRALAPGPK